MKLKLFLLAFHAIKPGPEFTKASGHSFSLPVDSSDPRDRDFTIVRGVCAGFEWAFTQAEAEEGGRVMAREAWPESEGWTDHTATAEEVLADVIREAYAALIEDEADGRGEESAPAPLLM